MMQALPTRGLDPLAVDWSNVTSAAFEVRHHYRYTYTSPIHALRQRLMMIPPDRHGDQMLLVHQLDVRGTSGQLEVAWEWDSFGNRVGWVRAERVEQAVDFEATFRVQRGATPRPGRGRRSGAVPEQDVPVKVTRAQLEGYLSFTSLTAPDDRLRSVAEDIRAQARTVREQAELAHDWAAAAIRYQLGVTGVQTPAAMALYLGAGVCQDYAHLQLTVMRLLGIPCRYVSGHLLGEGAPHAWVEALLPDPQAPGRVGVVAYDPTHHRQAGVSYVTVAVGRDFAEVTMTSGWFSGAASGKLSWSKQAEIVGLMPAGNRRQGDGAAA